MGRSQVAAPGDLEGASEAEIDALEQHYGLLLPSTYRQYLSVMGHRSGRLFTSDHMAVFYSYVWDMTQDLRNGTDPALPSQFQLPKDALIVAGRLGAAWEFIRCGQGVRLDDSEVWYFDERDWTIRRSHPSVFAWLEAWCGFAEEAIADGYFERNPKGTTP